MVGVLLRFEGLDTIADIYVNHEYIGDRKSVV